jgi:hypothetical protein
MTAGTVFIHAACLTFSASSMTSATSESRTGAPFRVAMIKPRYSLLDNSWSFAPMA